MLHSEHSIFTRKYTGAASNVLDLQKVKFQENGFLTSNSFSFYFKWQHLQYLAQYVYWDIF